MIRQPCGGGYSGGVAFVCGLWFLCRLVDLLFYQSDRFALEVNGLSANRETGSSICDQAGVDQVGFGWEAFHSW